LTSATVVPLGVKPKRRKTLEPFTVEHFRVYASRLVFDDGRTREPEDWQLDYAREVFRGVVVPGAGRRRALDVAESWLLVPEGNGKTTFVGELALYGADWALRPWIPVGASSRDQAKTLYTQAKGFVDNTPGLARRFKCFDGYRAIRPLNPKTGKPRSGRGVEICPWDPATNDGVIPFPFFICDELHRHPDMTLWRLWKGKSRKRGAVGIGISTAGEPGTEFEEARDRVREQCARITRRHGGTLYRGNRMSMWEYRLERPELAQDPEAVAAVNPLSTVTPEDMAEELESPTLDIGDFKRLKCNLPSRSTFAAITDEEWAKARSELPAIPDGERIDCGRGCLSARRARSSAGTAPSRSSATLTTSRSASCAAARC
jgi:phage terminase large subunit-like protein